VRRCPADKHSRPVTRVLALLMKFDNYKFQIRKYTDSLDAFET
jgi:hypothetical protein